MTTNRKMIGECNKKKGIMEIITTGIRVVSISEFNRRERKGGGGFDVFGWGDEKGRVRCCSKHTAATHNRCAVSKLQAARTMVYGLPLSIDST